MNRNEIKAKILDFFEVIEGGLQAEDREVKLTRVLDELAMAVHFAEYPFDASEFPDAVVREYGEIREIVSKNFPDLGYYNGALEIADKIAESENGVGDAIDDICDIAGDLEEVLWCWENTSVDDALWHFKFSFDSHWGKHLRDLQLYLYAKAHGW